MLESEACENTNYDPLIVAFCCNWCSYAGADGAGTARKSYPANIKIIKVPCSCRVNPLFVLRALAKQSFALALGQSVALLILAHTLDSSKQNRR